MAPGLHSAGVTEHVLAAGIANQRLEALGLGAQHGVSEGSETVVATARVGPGSRPTGFADADIRQPAVRFTDQLLFEEALEESVKGAGTESDRATGPLLHLFDDGVSVPLAIGQSQEDLEGKWRKWQKRKVVRWI